MKGHLLQALKDCEHPSCKDIETKYRIGELDANGIDYDLVCGRLLINIYLVNSLW